MCDRRCGQRRVCAERRASGRRTVADTIGGAARRRIYGRQAAPADQRASAEAGTRETPTELQGRRTRRRLSPRRPLRRQYNRRLISASAITLA
jgi:hypothetical protein